MVEHLVETLEADEATPETWHGHELAGWVVSVARPGPSKPTRPRDTFDPRFAADF